MNPDVTNVAPATFDPKLPKSCQTTKTGGFESKVNISMTYPDKKKENTGTKLPDILPCSKVLDSELLTYYILLFYLKT